MAEVSELHVVPCDCGALMKRKFGFRVSAGRKQRYARPIISDSLAVSPDQIPEHRKMFPDIEVTAEGQPVFDNFTDHEAYLKKCNIQKLPQKIRRKGKRTA
jgi:hypothetical protein